MFTRTLLASLLLAGFLAGCGSQSSASPTAVANKTYVDPNFGFRFTYPGMWKAPRQGSANPRVGPNNYFVHLTLPGQVAGMEVQVSGQVTRFPRIRNGQRAKDPTGPDIFTYYHARMAGFPALRVLRSYKGQVDEIATFINVGHREYAVRTLISNPPFPADVTAGYNLIVRTIRVAPAG